MQKDLCDMNKPEKKKFLAVDLAERLIRVEQNISASFGQSIPYNKTNFYLSMTPKQKNEFEDYLKSKIKKRFFFSLIIFLPLFFIGLLNFTPTGNVISVNLSDSNTLIFEGIALGLSLIFIIAGLISFISRINFDKKFKHHTKIIDKFVIGKHSIRK